MSNIFTFGFMLKFFLFCALAKNFRNKIDFEDQWFWNSF